MLINKIVNQYIIKISSLLFKFYVNKNLTVKQKRIQDYLIS